MDEPKISEREERFAQNYVIWRDASKAYRATFDCSRMKDNTVWRNAWEFKKRPAVLARIEELRRESAAEVTRDLSVLLGDLARISSADPSRLIRHEVNNCRHCHGKGFKWQWKNEAEWANACAAVIDKNAEYERRRKRAPAGDPIHDQPDDPMPSNEGGYGFVFGFPNPDCPVCLGEGQPRTVIADMRTLGPNEARLYAGIKQTKDGIEVKMRDQDGAIDKLMRALGAYKDGVPPAVLNALVKGTVGEPEQVVSIPLNAQDAADFYLKFVKKAD